MKLLSDFATYCHNSYKHLHIVQHIFWNSYESYRSDLNNKYVLLFQKNC